MPQKNPELDTYAFMPSSNDALHSPAQDESPSPRTRTASATSIDGRLNGSNGRGSAQFGSSGFPNVGRDPAPQPTIHEREQIPSASTVRSGSVSGTKATTDENFWYNLYQKEKQAHHEAACTWNEERKRLVRERDELLSELASSRGLSRQVSGTSNTGIENDKVFYDPSMVERAAEGLRSLSVVESVSNRSSRDSSQTRDPSSALSNSTSNNLAGWNGPGLLPSIVEERGSISELPLKSVRLASEPDETITVHIEASSPENIIQTEGPRSPPSTALHDIGSPLPHNFIKHAGHTPMATIARSGRESFVDHPGQRPLGDLAKEVDGNNNHPVIDDGDRELRSPKILPAEPDKGAPMLDALTDKLKDVSEHPEEHEPEAVRYAALLDEVQKQEEEAAAAASSMNAIQQSPARGIEGAIKGTDDELGGVRLKMKKSLNFGSELGRLQ